MPPRPPRPVLLVCRGLDPVGTGRQVELAAAALRAAGHDVALAVITAGGEVAARCAAAGVPVHRLSRRPVVDAGGGIALVRLARRLGAPVVMAFGGGQALPAAAAAAAAGGRLVCQLGRPPRGTGLRLALPRADRVLAWPAETAAAAAGLGASRERIVVVPPAAAAAPAAGLSRAEIAARLGLDPAKIWTLCVAPLVASSRLERLLWAIDQLGVVHRGLEHVLVGAGPLERQLWHRARAQRLAERLRLVPQLDCLPDLLREVRLVWQSGEVACGGAILDGMARGLPAVAVDGVVSRGLVADGTTGRIVSALPESEFPRRAWNVIEDDGLAARYGAAARARAAECFPPERTAAAVVAAVAELTAGR
jgi:glycosyltransferase involved in cell wall biosynthesis